MNKSHTYHLQNTTSFEQYNDNIKQKKIFKKHSFSIEDGTETHTHVNVYLYNVKTLQLSFMRWPRGRRAFVHVIQIDSLLNSKWSIVKDKVNNLLYISVLTFYNFRDGCI